jgi:CHAT domain-containing protein
MADIPSPTPWSWQRLFSSSLVRGAAFALVILAGVFGIWRIFLYRSDVDKGLVALSDAYREQRPVEVRVSQQNYAPFLAFRGAQPERVHADELNYAERYLRDAVHNHPSPRARHALGRYLLLQRDFEQAIQQFEEALKADPNNAAIYADLGAAWLEKGKLSLIDGRANPTGSESGRGMQELGKSVVHLDKAVELDKTLPEPYFNRTLAEQYLTLYNEAERDWNEYLKLDSTSQWAAEARQNLKLLEERKAKTAVIKDQLIANFTEAYKAGNDESAWAALSVSRARTGNAIVETLIDDFLRLETTDKQQMLSYAGKVEQQSVQDRFSADLAAVFNSSTPSQRKTLGQARGLMKSAVQFYDRSEYGKAIELFSQARELFAKTSDEPEKLFAEAWIGYCHLRLQHPEISITTFEHLSTVFEAKSYRSLFAQSLMALADALTANDEYSRVLDRARQSLAVSEQIQDQANAIRCLQSETIVQNILGNYSDALAAIFRALSTSKSLPPDAKLTWPFYHEASVSFYFIGMPAVALHFENEALRLALAADLPLQTSRSYDRLALIQQRLHNYDEAMKNSELARVAAAKINNERTRTNILAHSAMNLGELYRETGDSQRAIASYDEALRLYQQLDVDIYQYRAHKGKLLALMALRDDAAAEAELQTVLYWFERNREKISEESYRNKFFDTGQNTYDLAVDFYYERKKDIRKALDYAEAYRARSLWDLMNTGAQIAENLTDPQLKLLAPVSPLTSSQVQPLLSTQTQLLEYAVLDDKVVIWVVTKDGLKSAHASITRDELDEKIRGYVRALSRATDKSDEEIKQQGKALYEKLIAPIEDYLDSRLLCIVPDKNLSLLPFAALVSPKSGRFLVEDYTLQTAPSATIFIKASQQAEQKASNKTNEQALIVGNPSFDREQFADLPDLPGARREAEGIARLYAARPLLGDAATSPVVKRLLTNTDVVHLATHAIPDERSPLLSKLLLSHGFLPAKEIYEMKFNRTRLVVLSACQTGIERVYQGEGAIGLARPFIASGVPLVVGSLWPVESESTADLMISFHKHRKQDHVSTVEALRGAQLEILRQQQPGSPRNYGWAAFVAVGGYAAF